MVHIIDTEKREIRVTAHDPDTTIEQVRAHIDKLYAGTEVADYAVVFQPAGPNVNITSNAMALPPGDIEYRLYRGGHYVTDF